MPPQRADAKVRRRGRSARRHAPCPNARPARPPIAPHIGCPAQMRVRRWRPLMTRRPAGPVAECAWPPPATDREHQETTGEQRTAQHVRLTDPTCDRRARRSAASSGARRARRGPASRAALTAYWREPARDERRMRDSNRPVECVCAPAMSITSNRRPSAAPMRPPIAKVAQGVGLEAWDVVGGASSGGAAAVDVDRSGSSATAAAPGRPMPVPRTAGGTPRKRRLRLHQPARPRARAPRRRQASRWAGCGCRRRRERARPGRITGTACATPCSERDARVTGPRAAGRRGAAR